MSDTHIETGKAPQIFVQCGGDLHIRSWADTVVSIGNEGVEATESDKGLTLVSKGDLSLTVPILALVTIQEAAGDLSVKNVDGEIVIDTLNGDAHLQNLGQVQVNSVSGDLSVRNLNGSCTIESVGGDASFKNIMDLDVSSIMGDCLGRNINGAATFKNVMGDLHLRTINNNVTVEQCQRDINLRNLGGDHNVALANGDIRLRGGLASGKHQFTAKGDIVIRWPLGASGNFEATSSNIRNRLIMEDTQEEDGRFVGRIGEGEVFVILNAEGRIIFKELHTQSESWENFSSEDMNFEFDLNGFGEQIASEINTRMTDFSRRMEQEFGPEFSQKIEKNVQKAAARAERAAEKAVQKAEEAARKARWQMEGANWSSQKSPKPPENTKAQKATEEEQIKILRMVEKGLISPEEANSLLEAIGT